MVQKMIIFFKFNYARGQQQRRVVYGWIGDGVYVVLLLHSCEIKYIYIYIYFMTQPYPSTKKPNPTRPIAN